MNVDEIIKLMSITGYVFAICCIGAGWNIAAVVFCGIGFLCAIVKHLAGQ